jgi:hypothetical protein
MRIKKFESYSNGYEKVYRGQPEDAQGDSPGRSIWVTYDREFAEVYGDVVEYMMPSDLNILDTEYRYVEFERLVDEFGGEADYEEYKYEPTEEFIDFLRNKGYDGFENGDNILVFDKSVLYI